MRLLQRRSKRLGTTTKTAQPEGPPTVADVVLGSLFLLVFLAAYLQSGDWSFRTALFPRVVTVTGCMISGIYLISLAVRFVRTRSSLPNAPAGIVTGRGPVDEDEENDHEVEYVYATAGAAAWAAALGWVALYIVILYLGGLFVASAVFTTVYLRWGAGRSMVFAVIYGMVMTVILYLALRVLLVVPVPVGVLG